MIDIGEMASQHFWGSNCLLFTERTERLPFGYKAVPDPLLSPLSRVKMRIDKGPRLSTPVHEKGIFLDLEEKRGIGRFIPEEGKLGLGHEFYLQALRSTAFEQSYGGTALEMWIVSAHLSVEQSKVDV
jgi:hypothetical protein